MPGQSIRRRSDLVQDAKLNTTFTRGITRHLYHDSSTKSERRKIMIEERWTREKELGNGTYGHVWLERCILGRHENELRAVKRIVKRHSGGASNDCDKELEAIAKFSHRNYAYCFVQSSGWFENDDHVYIAMEYMALGDLQKHLLTPFSEPHTGAIISQLLEGLQFMHTNDFAHRDLKPSNILVHRAGPDWWVKIGDFGISKRADNDSTALRTVTGTFGYIAPEVFGFATAEDRKVLKDTHSYTSAVDIWSLGEICYRLITNQPTFATLGQLSSYASGISNFPVDVLETSGASRDCIDFIRLTMSASPSLRPSADIASEHRWIGLYSESLLAQETEERHSWEEVAEPPVVLEPSAVWSTIPSSNGFAVPRRPFANTQDIRVSDEFPDDKPNTKNGRPLHRLAEATPIPKSDQRALRGEEKLIHDTKSLAGRAYSGMSRPFDGFWSKWIQFTPSEKRGAPSRRRRRLSLEEEQAARSRRRRRSSLEEEQAIPSLKRRSERTAEEQAAHERHLSRIAEERQIARGRPYQANERYGRG